MQEFFGEPLKWDYSYNASENQILKHKASIPHSLWVEFQGWCSNLKEPQETTTVLEWIVNGKFFNHFQIPQLLLRNPASLEPAAHPPQPDSIQVLEQALEEQRARVQALTQELDALRKEA